MLFGSQLKFATDPERPLERTFDALFQLLMIREFYGKMLVVCFNPNPIFGQSFKSYDHLIRHVVQQEMSELEEVHPYSREMIELLYQRHEINFLHLYSQEHQAVMRKIKPLNVFAAFGLVVQTDKRFGDCHSLVMHKDGRKWRGIQQVDQESKIGKNKAEIVFKSNCFFFA